MSSDKRSVNAIIAADVKRYGKVAVLSGGNAAERAVSLRSGAAVLKALQDAGVDAYGFDPAERDLVELRRDGVDRVINMIHGRGGEDGRLQGALHYLGVPFTGSDVTGSALCMDKVRSKYIFQSMNIPTAPFAVIERNAAKSTLEESSLSAMLRALGGTVMVKPALEGSSIGMSKVSDASDFSQALAIAFEHDEQVLVEQFITGKEYTVSVLLGEPLPSINMSTSRVFYDYEAKYHSDTTEYHCPSGLPFLEEKLLGKMAMQAFHALNASGWGRVDFMRDNKGNFYTLEVNTVPGMTEKSLVPMAAKQAGMSFQALCLSILQTSFTSSG